jgi:aspartate kinase
MDTVVKKFGGTSLRTEERINLAVDEVAEDLEAGNPVVSVVSAMGKDGDPYATDTLIGLMEDVQPEIDPLKQDLIMSCGEVISASLFSHYLDAAGYDSVPMTGYQAGIFTDAEFGDARIVDVDPVRVEEYIRQEIPVVLAGFQGRTVRGQVTTLGRGGSDTTALRVGGAVDARMVEIFTDVPGVAVVDPGVVDDPPFFSSVSRNAMLNLARAGASVIHPRAVSAAIEFNVPFTIKCSWQKGRETVVGDKSSSAKTPLGIAVNEGCWLGEGAITEPGDNYESRGESSGIRFSGNDDKTFTVWKKETPELSEVDTRPVSLVTAVPTLADRASELIEEAVDAVDGRSYLGKKVESDGVQFVVEPDAEAGIVRDIYGRFYQ